MKSSYSEIKHALQQRVAQLQGAQSLLDAVEYVSTREQTAKDAEERTKAAYVEYDSVVQDIAKAKLEHEQAVADAQVKADERTKAAWDAIVEAESLGAVRKAEIQDEIDAKQAELVSIGRDLDAARQAANEKAGLVAEVAALRAVRDDLVAKLMN